MWTPAACASALPFAARPPAVYDTIPHINRPDAERTMVEIINAMAAGLAFVVIEDNDTSALIVTSEVASVTLGAPPIAAQVERPRPRPVPLPQPQPERGVLIAN